MNKANFLSLKPGQYIVDREYNIYGQVKEGAWINHGIISVKEGSGLYIVWDDGDRSCVGFELYNDEEIEKFEEIDFEPT